MATYNIGIVIVSYNVAHFLSQTLASVYASRLNGLSIEVWVVDNNSTDQSVSFVKKQFPQVNLIENAANVGFSKANNQAIAKMNSDYVLLLNPDTVIEEDTLIKCVSYMSAHPKTGALGPKMIDGSGRFLPESKRQLPGVWNSFCKLSYLSDLFPKSRVFSGYNLGYLPDDETAECDVLCGAFMMMPRKVLDTVGLLDERFFMYGEDIDLSYRIKKAGFDVVYFAETSIIHYKGESTKKSSLNYVRTFYGAMGLYVEKHYSAGSARFFAYFIKIAIVLRAILSAFMTVGKQWFRPVLDGIFIYMGLHCIKHLWATYYFRDSLYYEGSSIDWFLPAYVIMWLYGAFSQGWYEPNTSSRKALKAVVYGSLGLLVIYSLLPIEMRTSRAILLFGSLWALTIFVGTSWFVHRFLDRQRVRNIALVGNRAVTDKLAALIHHSKGQKSVYHIALGDSGQDYDGSLETLQHIIDMRQIDEVVFSLESMSMHDIIKTMTTIKSHVQFKISGTDGLNIIGSNSKNKQGEYYSLDIEYALSMRYHLFNKRLFDMMAALIGVVFSVFLWPILFFDRKYWINIKEVLLSRKTWVGYGGDKDDYGFLPQIKPCIMQIPFDQKINHMHSEFYLQKNIDYARSYTVWVDMKYFFTHLWKMAQ